MLVALVFLLCLLVPCAGACENVAEIDHPSSSEKEQCNADISENVCEENLQEENCDESPVESEPECPDKPEDQVCPENTPEDTDKGDFDDGSGDDSSGDESAEESDSDESADVIQDENSDVSDSANNNRDEHNGHGYGEENVTIGKKPAALNISATNISVDIERPKTLPVIPQDWINLCVKTNLGEQEKNCIIRWIICPENGTDDGSYVCEVITGNNQTCTNLSNGNYTVNVTVWDSNWTLIGGVTKEIKILAPVSESDFSNLFNSNSSSVSDFDSNNDFEQDAETKRLEEAERYKAGASRLKTYFLSMLIRSLG